VSQCFHCHCLHGNVHDDVTRGKALDISVGDLRGERNRKELDGIVRELKEALGRCVLYFS
jgi:methyl coenzyme M reductase subunit C